MSSTLRDGRIAFASLCRLFRRPPRTLLAGLLALAASVILSGSSSDEKRLSVYSNVANYSLPVAERSATQYVGLLELLDPLGAVSAQASGAQWVLRFNQTQAEFAGGSALVRAGNRNVQLHSNFILENGRGLVPLSSLNALLPVILHGPVTFHEASRRLFIGSVEIHFSAQLNKASPQTLTLSFSGRVNPTIGTEPGKLRMVFNRDAVVGPGTPLSFDSKTIENAAYSEQNGTAEIAISTSVPLIASFSPDARSITLSPVQQTASVPAGPQSAPPAAPAPPLTNPTPATPQPPNSAQPGQSPPLVATALPPPKYFAIVDASHGGDERGAALADQVAEKDVTLALARRLRQELQNRGLPTLVLRDSDSTLTLDHRAAMANSAHPAIYIVLHASEFGSGVRLYTAMMPWGGENSGPFLDWPSAQTAYLAHSQAAAAGLAEGFEHKKLPVRVLTAPLRPLNSLPMTAVGVELAPPSDRAVEFYSSQYQQLVVSALADQLVVLRGQLESWR